MTEDATQPAKGDLRRAALVERLADTLLAHGLSAASLRSLGKAVGVSDRMLLYYFPTKDALMAAALMHLAGRLEDLLTAYAHPEPQSSDALFRRIGRQVLDEALWPYMRLGLDLAARAGAGEEPYMETARQVALGFLTWIKRQLDAPQDRLDGEAARLLAQLEGLLVLKAAGLEEACAEALGGEP